MKKRSFSISRFKVAVAMVLAMMGVRPVFAQTDTSPPRIVEVTPAPAGGFISGIGLSTIEIRFSEEVQPLMASHFHLLDDTDAPIPFSVEAVPGDGARVRLVLEAPRQEGRATLIVEYAITDLAGNALDGEVADPGTPAFPSGDGVRGGQTVLRYDLFGSDYNRDRQFDSQDYFDFLEDFFSVDPTADINADGSIDSQDFFDFLNLLLAVLGGETDPPPPTDGLAPSVSSFNPDGSAPLGAALSLVTVTFDEPVRAGRLLPTALYAITGNGQVRASSTVSVVNSAAASFSFVPPLPRCDRYTLRLCNSIADLSGESLESPVPVELSGLTPLNAPTLQPYAATTGAASVFVSGAAPGANRVEISGPMGILTLNTPTAGGEFSGPLDLMPNQLNTFYITAISPCNIRGAPVTARILSDQQPPELHIDFPLNNAQIQAATTDIAGRVGDNLSGFMGLTVTVNGQPALVDEGIGANGTFVLPGFTLPASGSVNIVAVATDGVGNTTSKQITISRLAIPPNTPRMEIFSGNGQTGMIQVPLPFPLQIRMTNADGSPFVNKVVTMRVTRSDGRLSAEYGPPGEQLFQTHTDSGGYAYAYWTLGTDAGRGNNRVEVTSRDIAGTIVFCASATPGPSSQINIGAGNNQRAEAGAPAPEPLIAWVSDSCNGIPNVPVTFTVDEGGGLVNGQTSVTVNTSATGHAQVQYTLGPERGNQTVVADFAGNPTGPATFVTYALVREPGMPTSFSGLILDNASQPIEGATCTLLINGQLAGTMTSSRQGQFDFANLAGSGRADIFVNGLTATHIGADGPGAMDIPAGSYPVLHFEFNLVPNAANSLPKPVLLPPLDPANARSYSTTQDTVLTVQGVEGLRMIVRAGSMRMPPLIPGTPGEVAPSGTIISLNQVHHDDVPMPMPDGAAPLFAWTLQPGGATFDPPITIEYPNMSALMPGAIANFLSFNHDTSRFEIVSSGHVVEDGSIIVTDAGSGLSRAGWGCNCPPYSVTGECETCPDRPQCTEQIEECEYVRGQNASCCPDIFGFRSRFNTTLGVCEYRPLVCGPGQDGGEWFDFLRRFIGDGLLNGFYDPLRILDLKALSDRIYRESTTYEGPGGRYDHGSTEATERYRNAHLHTMWQIEATRYMLERGYSEAVARDYARLIGDAHEVHSIRTGTQCGGPGVSCQEDSLLDLHNNVRARDLGVRFANDPRTSAELAFDALDGRISLAGIIQRVTPENRSGVLAAIPPPRFCDFASPVPPRGIDLPRLEIIPHHPVLSVGGEVQLQVLVHRTDGSTDDVTALSSTLYSNFDASSQHITHLGNGLFSGLSIGVTTLEVTPGALIDGEFLTEGVVVSIGDADDLDGDGLSNEDETALGLDPLYGGDAMADADNDGLSADAEASYGTERTNADTDGDGRLDGEEIYSYESDPLVFDHSLTDGWLVGLGGQTVNANALGGVLLRNVAAADQFGSGGPGTPPDFLADDPTRVIGIATVNGQNLYAFSEPFQIRQGQRLVVPNLTFSQSPPPSPRSLTLTANPAVIEPNQTTQLTVTGTLNDGTQVDLTERADWTTYRTSNPAVATVGPNGLITAHTRGTVFITAVNDAATAIKRIDVATSTISTTLQGIVRLQDGTPVEGAEITTEPFGGLAISGFDGTFTLTLAVPATTTTLTVRADVLIGGQPHRGRITGIVVGGGAITDCGVLTLRPVQSGDLFPGRQYDAGTNPSSVAIGDLDGDGDADLTVTNSNSNNVSVLLNNGDGNFASGALTYAVGTNPRSVAIGDLNGDGDADLVVANRDSASVSLLLNNGNGTFALSVNYAAGTNPQSVALRDMDGDGDADLAVANNTNPGTVSLLLNNGNGTFAARVNYAAGSNPISVAIGDLDSDGDADLAVANNSSNNVSVLLNNGNGTFAASVNYAAGTNPQSVAMGDLDGDGDADLAVANYSSSNVSVLRNNGNGTFAARVNYAAGSSPSAVTIGDLSGDGEADLVVANANGGRIAVMINNGDGSFAAMVNYTAASPSGLAISDLDGDGDADLAVTHLTNAVSVRFNNGDGTLVSTFVSYTAGDGSSSVAFADLDGDDDADVAVANRDSDDVSVLLNDSSGALVGNAIYPAGNGPSCVASGDLDSDGDADLVVANSLSFPYIISVLLNSGNGTFTARTDYTAGARPTSVSIGDLDGDGDADLAVANWDESSVSVMQNNGSGVFAARVNYFVGLRPTSLAIAEVEGDADSDLVVANYGSANISVLANNGNGTFAARINYPVGPNPRAVAIGDLDSDGDADVAVAKGEVIGDVAVLLNNGNGTFAASVSHAAGTGSFSVAIGDLDADGDADLAVANYYSYNVAVLQNNGNGTFAASVSYAVGAGPVSVAIGDLDGDSDADIATANLTSPSGVSVLLNMTIQPGGLRGGTEFANPGEARSEFPESGTALPGGEALVPEEQGTPGRSPVAQAHGEQQKGTARGIPVARAHMEQEEPPGRSPVPRQAPHPVPLAHDDNGRIIGHFQTDLGDQHAFLWTPETGPIDLNDLLEPNSPWVLNTAEAFDGPNIITGRGTLDGREAEFRLEVDWAAVEKLCARADGLEAPGTNSQSTDSQDTQDLSVKGASADFDGNGVVESEDFFRFLDAFFAGDRRADFDGSGEVDSGDYFGYLECYLRDCV